MKENIFEPVTIDTVVSPETKTVIAIHLLVIVVPFVDNDLNNSGLNS